MPDPNFMVIGAQKSGTTWLARILRKHPDVYIPQKKELRFFSRQENYDKGLAWYRRHFAGHKDEKAVGECTPNYLWICLNHDEIDQLGVIPNKAPIVYKHYPNLKLIVCMRDPVDRAISAYYHFIAARRFPPHKSIFDVGHTNGIITMGYYYRQLSEWLSYYTKDQFLFLIYEEDIKTNRLDTIKTVFRFLGVDERFMPDNVDRRYNARSGHLYMHLNYYSPLFARFSCRLFPFLRSIDFPKIELDPREIHELSMVYAKENEGLEDLIGRRVPWQVVHES